MTEQLHIIREEAKRMIDLKAEYICPAHPVRTIVSLKNGDWYCVETDKIYQLTEVNI